MPGYSKIEICRCKDSNGEYQYEAFIKNRKVADIYYVNGKDSRNGFRTKVIRTNDEILLDTMAQTKNALAKRFGVLEER